MWQKLSGDSDNLTIFIWDEETLKMEIKLI